MFMFEVAHLIEVLMYWFCLAAHPKQIYFL